MDTTYAGTVGASPASEAPGHSHVFLGEGHNRNARRTWAVIALCGVLMAAEIVGGLLFGSIALVADGLHMSTHAGALLLAALAYRYARRHAEDDRFTFGTGKLGELAGFTSAIVLAMIALLIAYEAVLRLIDPVAIDYDETIAIAVLGLGVNLASVWLLGSDHDHGHGHHHGHGHGHHDRADAAKTIVTPAGTFGLEIHEDNVPPRFRLTAKGTDSFAAAMTIETLRPDGSRRTFAMIRKGDVVESVETIPEPHAFEATLLQAGSDRIGSATFEEHAHELQSAMHRDNNMRAAVVHVVADAAVSVLVIGSLLLARFLGWTWMDPLAAIVGSVVIASWAYTLVRDTGGVLLDMQPDRVLTGRVRNLIKGHGDRVADLHVWRLGPGHLGAIVSIMTERGHGPDFYRDLLAPLGNLSHVTVEVRATPVR